MAKSAKLSYRRAGTREPAAAVPLIHKLWGKLLLLLLSVVLLSLSFAPYKQFYLAWFALVPWLLVVRNSRSVWRAFAWSWLAGVLYFSANMWWLANVTGPGSIMLMILLGTYWGGAGAVIRGLRILEVPSDEQGNESPAARRNRQWFPIFSLFAIPAIWVAIEWLRGAWPFGGLPWLYLGHTQTPVLHLCQIADVTGELGVSFWVALANALITLAFIYRPAYRRLTVAACAFGIVTAGVVAYGVYRFSQESAVSAPGPTVMVVQPNIPQRNDGEKGAEIRHLVEYHQKAARQALAQSGGRKIDLIVWSETMMPPLNPEAMAFFRTSPGGKFWRQTLADIGDLARKANSALLVGGDNWNRITPASEEEGGFRIGERHNAAYYITRAGTLSDMQYHKVHLVPFGEYIPFKESAPWLYRMILSFGPRDANGRNVMEDFQLGRGDADNLTVFPLAPTTVPSASTSTSTSTSTATDGSASSAAGRSWRFVVPICFEDIDAGHVAAMFRGPGGTKRADLIVNITNDGWFKGNERPQHLQAAQFRSIENRAPTARSVNTGISGFVDSMGRPHDLVADSTEGTSTAAVRIDSRVTPFTRYGNVFAWACVLATGLMAAGGCIRWFLKRRRPPAEP